MIENGWLRDPIPAPDEYISELMEKYNDAKMKKYELQDQLEEVEDDMLYFKDLLEAEGVVDFD